jgi:hypothetical protein
MADRSESPAYAALTPSARKMLAVIEAQIGGGSSASVSYSDFALEHRIARATISKSVKALVALGMIEVSPGKRLVGTYRISSGWRSIDARAAAQLVALAREPMPQRRFEKRQPLPMRQAKAARPMVARPRAVQRRVPSLVRLPWQAPRGVEGNSLDPIALCGCPLTGMMGGADPAPPLVPGRAIHRNL